MAKKKGRGSPGASAGAAAAEATTDDDGGGGGPLWVERRRLEEDWGRSAPKLRQGLVAWQGALQRLLRYDTVWWFMGAASVPSSHSSQHTRPALAHQTCLSINRRKTTVSSKRRRRPPPSTMTTTTIRRTHAMSPHVALASTRPPGRPGPCSSRRPPRCVHGWMDGLIN